QAAGKSDILIGDKAVPFTLNLGSVGIEIGNKASLNINRTAWEDGTVTQQNTWQDNLDHTTDITTKIGLDGQPIESETTWTMVMANYDPTVTSYLKDSFDPLGKSSYGTFEGPQHVQLQFNATNLTGIRQLARANLPGGDNRLATLDAHPEMATTPQEQLAA